MLTHTQQQKYTTVLRISLLKKFFRDELDYLIILGISFIDLASSYGSYGSNYIAFSEIYFEAGTLNEVLNISGNLGKVNSIVKC